MPAIENFQLGWDGERLTIPYLSPKGPWLVKSRCIWDHDCKEYGHPKYDGDAGLGAHLFNASTLLDADTVVVVEGELDAISGWQTGYPHVGQPGAQTWSKYPYWLWCFDNVNEVVIVADFDFPLKDKDGNPKRYGVGEESARRIRDDLRKHHPEKTVRYVVMPYRDDIKHDANSFIHQYGQEAYLEYLGLL